MESTDRNKRQEVYLLVANKRLSIKHELNDLFNKLIERRHQVAQNAGFDNFRDYSFASLGRFDYTAADCFEFHEAVAQTVVPMVNKQAAKRKEVLQLDA